MKFLREDQLLLGVFPAAEVVAPALELITTTRVGGVSRKPFDSLNLGIGSGDKKRSVHENRRVLLETLGKHRKHIAMGGQIHGKRVRVVERGGLYDSTDGLITSRKGLTLVISTADCFPLVLYSPPEQVVAALHVGSKGLADGIIEETLAVLTRDFRIDPSSALAFIGPGICRKCYTIGEKRAGSYPEAALTYGRDGIHLDIEKLIKLKLKESGLKRRFIYSTELCTSCRKDLFFSYRRDGGTTGRHWTLASIKP